MKFHVLLLALAASIVMQFHANAQPQKLLKIDNLMDRKLYPSSPSNLQWRNNTLFTWNAGNSIVQSGVKVLKTDTLINLQTINLLHEKSGIKTMKSLPALKWESESVLLYQFDHKFIRLSPAENKLILVNAYETSGENAEFEPVTGRVAYTKDNNLYVSDNQQVIAVTNDTDKGIVNGQTVHRNEFGITDGIFWSPKGSLLAFYRMDETMVTQYPLVNINERIAKADFIRYPMAGMASHHVTVGIFNPLTNKLIYLKTGEPAEQYLTNISWSPDEKTIFIAVLNRDQNHLWLNQYNAETGEFIKTLFEETDNEYVEPLNGMYFLANQPDKFIWQSRRNGYNHLYLYDINGSLLKQLTTGLWEVTALSGTDKACTQVYFSSTIKSPLERHFCSVDLKNGSLVQYTTSTGTHQNWASPDGKYMLDKVSSLSIGSRTSLLNNKGIALYTISEDINPLKEYKTGETSLVTIKNKNGTDLYGRLILPVDFDASKKYPVVVYVYGGPHSQLVSNTWLGGANLYFNYLATKGYVVWTLDNRGTSARGADFEQAIHRHLGDLESEDQMCGVNYLKTLPYIDSTRIGLDGWSYGGFMTLTLKLRYPDVFKVATCGGPVIDWQYYEIMYGERYMDTPEQNPEGYKKASILNYIDNLQGKLLVMHGAMDNTVVWQNSLQFIQSCISKGKQIDYFVYPQHEHNVGGTDRLHLFKKLVDYYDQNL